MSVQRSRTCRSGGGVACLTALSIAGAVLIVTGGPVPPPVLAQTVVDNGAAKKDPAEARKDVISGVKAYEKGKMAEAIELLSKGLRSGGLAPADTAKALYYRGLANRKSGHPAQAISDLTSAVWLKDGLSEVERKQAMEARSAAYSEAGLQDPGMTDARSQVAANSGSSNPSSSTSSSPSTSSSGSSTSNPLAGVGNFFSGLFGGGSSSSANAATETAAASDNSALETASTGPGAVSVSAWNSTTQAAPATGAATAKAAPSQQWDTAARPTTGQSPGTSARSKSLKKGRFEVQVAAVRSREDAERLARDVKQKYASLLSARVPEIEETVFGNMGTFYRVSIGPFAKADDTASLCQALKTGGYDCMVAKN